MAQFHFNGLVSNGVIVLISRGVSFTQTVIVARLCTIEEFGKYVSLVAIISIIARLCDLGMPAAIIHYGKKNHRVDYSDLIKKHAINIFGILFLILFISININIILDLKFSIISIISSTICILLYVILGMQSSLFILQNKHQLMNIILALIYVFQIIFLTGLYYLKIVNIDNIIITILLSLLLAIIIQNLFLNRKEKINTSNKDYSEIKEFGFRVQKGVVFKLISSTAEVPLIAFLFGLNESAIYSIGLTVREMMNMPITVYGSIFQGKLLELISEDFKAGIRTTIKHFLRIQIIVSVMALFILLFYCGEIVEITYGTKYISDTKMFIIMGLCGAISSITSFIWLILQVAEKIEYINKQIKILGLININLIIIFYIMQLSIMNIVYVQLVVAAIGMMISLKNLKLIEFK